MAKESPMLKMPSGDGFNMVKFKWEQQRNNALSDREGRPIYDNVLIAYIMSPGAKNQVATAEIERHVWAGDDEPPRVVVNKDKMAIYGQLLEAWRENGGGSHVGTPLDEISIFDATQVAAMHEMGIHTVEELASLPDNNLPLGYRKWREIAKAYLDRAKEQKPMADLVARNQELEDKVRDLEEKIFELTAKLDIAESKKRKPRRVASDRDVA